MKIIENTQIEGQHGKPILLDVYYEENKVAKPVVVFAHGFKGFKDWGHWSLVAKAFATAGFVFVKFNFSHNGTTPDQPTDFADLEAFGQNNYSKELADFQAVLSWVEHGLSIPTEEVDKNNISIIGHSRGGPIAIVEAARNKQVNTLITWASVHDLGYAWSPAQVEKWKEKGVQFILNGRTFQEMPLYYQLYEDYVANQELFDVENTLKTLDKPFLIVHGENDPAVSFQAAHKLNEWSEHAELCIIDKADHVFGGRHPFEGNELPEASKLLVQHTVDFIKKAAV